MFRPPLLLRIGFGLIWMVNGLYCKIFNGVPRHEAIVSAILGPGHARLLTVLIGSAEVVMAVWIFSGWKAGLNARLQILAIAAMNLLEFLLVPRLLLFHRFNSVFVLLLILAIAFAYFPPKKMTAMRT